MLYNLASGIKSQYSWVFWVELYQLEIYGPIIIILLLLML